jgi:hypothetical protein
MEILFRRLPGSTCTSGKSRWQFASRTTRVMAVAKRVRRRCVGSRRSMVLCWRWRNGFVLNRFARSDGGNRRVLAAGVSRLDRD